jgi:hypothetical protein
MRIDRKCAKGFFHFFNASAATIESFPPPIPTSDLFFLGNETDDEPESAYGNEISPLKSILFL